MTSPTPSVGLVKIPVTDFVRATTWYREVLRLQEDFAVPEYGWAQYSTANVPVCLYEIGRGGGEGMPGGDTGIHLAVSDVEAFHASLVENGARLPVGLTRSDDDTVFFVVADPDGNHMKIVQA